MTALAMPSLQDQFLIGFLDQGLEELALDFKAGLMYARLDSVREMLVLLWYGKRKIQREPEREDLSLILDGAEGDGSLEAVGGTHGVSPYWYYGGPSCVPFIVSKGEPATPVARILPEIISPVLCILPMIAHQLAGAYKKPETLW